MAKSRKERPDAGLSRRGFIGASAAGVAVGATIPLAGESLLIADAAAQGSSGGGAGGSGSANSAKGPQTLKYPGKSDKLVVLGERPLVAETPESLLDDETTPIEKFFIRNNGLLPDPVTDPDAWKITIDGEVDKPLTITLGELKQRFTPVTLRMVMECGGNGRSFFTPSARGNQWTNGGVGCAEWTGVRLADVLKAAGVKQSAVFTGHYGADPHLSGEPGKVALSRGVPIRKALDEHNLIVWAMNGQPLPHIHGGPVRLLIAGWPGSVSAKWLTRVWVRERVHDGQGMGGTSYRVPIKPMFPGDKPDPANFRDLESMPVRAIITSPATGVELDKGVRNVSLRGAAWAGDLAVKEVAVSADFGATWHTVDLQPPRNRYDWQRWTAQLALPSEGYYEIWARATDERGVMQPHVAGNWNPQGYGANPMHRIGVFLT